MITGSLDHMRTKTAHDHEAARTGSGGARRWPGTAWHRDTPPARTRPIRSGPVGPQFGAGLVGTATVERRIMAGTAARLPSKGLAVLPGGWRQLRTGVPLLP
jgi:hypothetical protein